MTNIAIKFENVNKRYPLYHHITGGFKNFLFNLPLALRDMNKFHFQALININFEIKFGECVAFLGRNGAGKSTTLGLMAKVLRPNTGKVEVNERISPLLQLGGGFHPDLTGIENIKLNGVLLGLSRKQIANKMDQILEFSELGEFIHHPVRTYSSGMYSRLGFSVVAHLEPKILLIDEILSVGDASFREKCERKMLDFKKQGVTMILVTHSTDEVERLCDRIIWIENHQIKMDGLVKDVIPKYNNFFHLSQNSGNL